MKKSERQQALEAIIVLLKQKVPLSYLTAPLSPFSRELIFGVCRHFARLETIANQLVIKKPKGLEVWITILMGLYQLHYLKQPDYAVVKETVGLLNGHHAWAKGLVNAILRNYCRRATPLIEDLKSNEAFIYGHPKWMISRFQKDWPNDWKAILLANDMHPPMSLRINTQKTTIENYLTLLDQANISAKKHPNAPEALILDTPCDVHALPGFEAGLCSVQDVAAQLAVSLLNLQPNLRVLDACSAPGGKTGHILEKEPQLKTCIALDLDSNRLMRVQENLKRLELTANCIAGNAENPDTWWDGVLFDRILLDAPCSAIGVIRRNPDIKLLRTEADIHDITQVQRQILNALWPLLAPGGRLVYATCSVTPEENEQQLSDFIKKHTDCVSYHPDQEWGHSTPHGWQILPGEERMDGFFYGVLDKILPKTQ